MTGLASALLTSLLVAAAPLPVQDMGFRVIAPGAHAQLAGALPARSDDRYTLARARRSAESILSENGIDGSISGRIKSLLSTHRKMERKGVSLDDIADRIALRVIVGSEADAYTVYDALHARFAPVVGEQDDYIANPKANGYQSLHTAVWVEGRKVEFQVRTAAMHEAAESGAAAHWRYKLA